MISNYAFGGFIAVSILVCLWLLEEVSLTLIIIVKLGNVTEVS
jgi:hypothetical protein